VQNSRICGLGCGLEGPLDLSLDGFCGELLPAMRKGFPGQGSELSALIAGSTGGPRQQDSGFEGDWEIL
jgi:hypothetical protein